MTKGGRRSLSPQSARMVNFDQILESTSGSLPGVARFWDGPADGEICDACDKPITKRQLIMEGSASTLSNKKPIHFHVRCFQFGGYREASTEDVASAALGAGPLYLEASK